MTTSCTNSAAAFGRDEVIFMLGQAALLRLREELHGYRELLRLAQQLDRQSTKPTSLLELGKELSREQRRAVETEVRALPQNLLNALLEPVAGQPQVPEGRQHPPSYEQLIVGSIVAMGRGKYEELLRSLTTACAGGETALSYALGYLRWRQRRNADWAAKAIVPASISDFENFLADLLRTWYLCHQDALRGSKTVVKRGVLFEYATLDDQRRAGIDMRVDEVMADAPCNWQREVAKDGLRLDVEHLVGEWHDFLELFARRNAIVHNEDRVDDAYRRRTPWIRPPPDLGVPLQTGHEYAEVALNRLRAKSECLCVAVLACLIPTDKTFASLVTSLTFEALKGQRWKDVVVMADCLSSATSGDSDAHEVRINRWMALRKLGTTVTFEARAWQPPADDHRVELGHAALLGRVDETLEGLRKCREDGDNMDQLADWPVLHDLAQRSSKVQSALLAIRTTRSVSTSVRRRLHGRRKRGR